MWGVSAALHVPQSLQEGSLQLRTTHEFSPKSSEGDDFRVLRAEVSCGAHRGMKVETVTWRQPFKEPPEIQILQGNWS